MCVSQYSVIGHHVCVSQYSVIGHRVCVTVQCNRASCVCHSTV